MLPWCNGTVIRRKPLMPFGRSKRHKLVQGHKWRPLARTSPSGGPRRTRCGSAPTFTSACEFCPSTRRSSRVLKVPRLRLPPRSWLQRLQAVLCSCCCVYIYIYIYTYTYMHVYTIFFNAFCKYAYGFLGTHAPHACHSCVVAPPPQCEPHGHHHILTCHAMTPSVTPAW